jgi:hypothetical protein
MPYPIRRLACLALAACLFWPAALSYGHGGETDYADEVEAMYVAYYGRPGDPDGIDYWAQQLESADGSLAAIIDAFGTSQEYEDRFAAMDDEALVNNIYQQLFDRYADSEGLAFYVEGLRSGQYTLASIALEVYNGVQNLDALIVANKLTVAHAYTDHISENGLPYTSEQITDAKELLHSVRETNDSVTAAVEQLGELFELPEASNCTQYEGSFERIQSIVFDGYNCTNSACHGNSTPAGGLDLRADVAYQNLFRVNASANLSEPMQLIYPGEQALSFLYQKLAAGVNGTSLPTGGGTAMPVSAAPLTPDHLEAMRLWIRAGAPEFEDVDNVASLLGCSTGTTPKANKIDPPDAPALGEGVQLVSGPWTVNSNSEGEVCFNTYYDLEKIPGALPDWALAPCDGNQFRNYDGNCFAYDERTLTQDPQSHHSIIDVYTGTTAPLDPSWGEWQCLNGPNQGTACDPTRIGEPVSQGGADCGGELYVCGTPAQRSIACTGLGPSDWRQNTIDMGGSQAPISNNKLSEGVYSILPARGVITWNSHAFNLSPEATTIEQYNNFLFTPADDRQYRNIEIFDTKDLLVANVPPYQQRTYCSTYVLPRGTRLTGLGSHAHQRGVLWQTWLPPQDPSCKTSINCKPNTEPADYVSRIYNDPLVLKYDPPLEYDSTTVSERTLKFCVTYDNGLEFPDLLKRNSTSVGTTCNNRAYCAGGVTPGLSCGNDDSMCGDGGACDACTVKGGFTTEDEMMLLLGNFYVVPVN